MSKPPEKIVRTHIRWCHFCSRSVAILAIVVGTLVLTGWVLNVPILKTAMPDGPPMKPITAISITLMGVSLLLLQLNPWHPSGHGTAPRLLGRIAAGFVFLVGLAALSEYFLNLDWKLDDLLFADSIRSMQLEYGGRMARATAFEIVILGGALLTIDLRTRWGHRISQYLALAGLLLAFLAVASHLYGAPFTEGLASYISMATHAAFVFLMLGLGIFCAVPDRGLVANLTNDDLAGWICRCTLPLALTLPLVIGFLRLKGQQAGWYGTEFGLAIFATSNVVLFAFVICLGATSLRRIESARLRAALELKLVNDQLYTSEERLRLAVTGSGLGTWHWDVARDNYIWSERSLELFGFPKGTEMSREKRLKALHPGDRERAAAAFDKALKERTEYDIEYRVLWPDGSQHWIAARGRALYDPEGNPICVEGVLMDIQRRKEAEEKLQESEDRLQRVLDGLPAAAYTCDASGLITYFNERASELWGRSPKLSDPADRFCGSHAMQLPDGTPVPHEESWMAQALRQRRMYSGAELLVQRPNGTIRHVLSHVNPLWDSEGEITGGVNVLVDITELRKMDSALKEANEGLERKVSERTMELEAAKTRAELADRTKSQFLANMSHELRTPLNAIIGFTGTMLMGLPGPLTAEQRRQLETVRSSAKHQLSLINDLLDLAKIESGDVRLRKEPVSCNIILGEMMDTLRPLAEAKGLAFAADMPGHEVIVETDRRILSQIVINLVNNAIKFTEKGEVRVRLLDGKKARFEVHDTGRGLTPEDQQRLFRAFSRVERAGDKRQEGTGLGLHLSQRLAEALGGTIHLESEFGKGSNFTLELAAPPLHAPALL